MTTKTDPHGWPDPARPGYPANPERSGWHWLKHPEDLRLFLFVWNAELAGWSSGALHYSQGLVDLGFAYLGPCLTPAEAAEALAQARREGMEDAAALIEARAEGLHPAWVAIMRREVAAIRSAAGEAGE